MVPFRKPEKQPEEIPVKKNRQFKTPARTYILLVAVTVLPFAAAGVTMADSLLLKEQGSFFVGGRTVYTDALTGSTTGFLGHRHQHRKHHRRPDVRSVSDSRRAPIRMFPSS